MYSLYVDKWFLLEINFGFITTFSLGNVEFLCLHVRNQQIIFFWDCHASNLLSGFIYLLFYLFIYLFLSRSMFRGLCFGFV